MQTAQTFACNGSSLVFSCQFQALAATDVRCWLTAATGDPLELDLNRGFEVQQLDPVVVKTASIFPDGTALRVERRTAIDGGADVRRLTMVVQEMLADQRALATPVGEVVGGLPNRAQRARKVLAFDASGDLVALVGIDKASAAWLQLMLADTVYDNTGAGMVAYLDTLDYEPGTVGQALHALARRIDALGG